MYLDFGQGIAALEYTDSNGGYTVFDSDRVDPRALRGNMVIHLSGQDCNYHFRHKMFPTPVARRTCHNYGYRHCTG